MAASSSDDTRTPAAVLDLGEIRPIKTKESVGQPSSKLSRYNIKAILDNLKLNDPRFNYDRISMLLQNEHPDLVRLFDDMYMFSVCVAGNVGAKSGVFWNSAHRTGREHLVNTVKSAIEEELDSIPLTEVNGLPLIKDDLQEFLENFDQRNRVTRPLSQKIKRDPAFQVGYWKPALVEYIRMINKQNSQIKLELPRADSTDNTWMDYDYSPEIMADQAWQRIHLRDMKNKILRVPTTLSLEQWIEKIAIDRNIDHIRTILNKKSFESRVEQVQAAVCQAVTPDFYSAFLNGMSYAQEKYPGINMLSSQFHDLLQDVKFIRLVSGIYVGTQNTSSKFTSAIGKRDVLTRQSQLISQFLEDSSSGIKRPYLALTSPSSSSYSIYPGSQDIYPVPDFLKFANL